MRKTGLSIVFDMVEDKIEGAASGSLEPLAVSGKFILLGRRWAEKYFRRHLCTLLGLRIVNPNLYPMLALI
jgi:hypothetical protein